MGWGTKQFLSRLANLTVLLIMIGSSSMAYSACQRVRDTAVDIPANVIVAGNYSPSPAGIRMPKNIANGTEIYRMTARINSYQSYRINCESSVDRFNYYTKASFVGPTPGLSGQTSSLGTVYATGTEGIGMVVFLSNVGKPLETKYYFREGVGYCNSDHGCGTYAYDADIKVALIKTGDITVSKIDLATLPKLEVVVGGDNSPGDEKTIFQPQFTGTLNFSQATCALAESSKTVDLGTWHIKDFAAAGASTPWVEASIRLINCNYGGAQNYKHNIMGYDNDTMITNITQPLTTSAAWHLKVTPATSVVNNTAGIMAISTTEPYHASGVGIQLSSSNTSLNAIKFSETRTGTMVSGTNAIMTLPLYARYIKTGSTVTAGLANGKVTYLVEYK